MIEIICDQFGLHHVRSDDIEIHEADQYEECLQFVRDNDQGSNETRIIVRNPGIFHWFDAIAKKYGCQVLKIDPVSELKKALNVLDLPFEFRANPAIIIDLELLQKSTKEPIKKGETAKDWLLRVILSNEWKGDNLLSQERIAQLILWLSEHSQDQISEFANQLIDNQFNTWINNASDQSVALGWLKEEPFERADFLLWEQLLNKFPESKVADWLQQKDIWYILNKFPARKQVVPILDSKSQLPDFIANYVRSFLVERWKISPIEALSYISGKLDIERNFLNGQLKDQLINGIALEKDIFNKICQLDKFPDVIATAKKLVPAKEPENISYELTVKEIQVWLRDEYLPFYHSCSLINNLELTQPYIKQFEKWLVKNYKAQLFKEDGMAYRQINNLKGEINNVPVLIVLFDGLDYLSAQNELLPALVEQSLTPEGELLPYLSFLPTQTHIAKPTVIRGKMIDQIPPEKPSAKYYQELLQSSLKIQENEIKAATNKDMRLVELVNEPAKAYLYLDNELDSDVLHILLKPYMRLRKYTEHIKKQARAIADAVVMAKELHDVDLKVVICSDHGFTEVFKGGEIINVDPKSKYKSRTILASELGNSDDIDKSKVWILKANTFGLNEDLAIPFGYNCFGKRPQGATHGGCTPQELAVPWFSVRSGKPSYLQILSFSIEGEIFRRKKDNAIILIVSNPNDYQVTIESCEINNIDISAYLPIKIPKNGVQNLAISYDASNINDNYIEIKGTYNMKSFVGEKHENFAFKIQTTGAMATEFDDDFDI